MGGGPESAGLRAAPWLVHPVEEEKDICIGVLVVVCHLGLNPFSCTETADLSGENSWSQ
jgi:hypothetical protein